MTRRRRTTLHVATILRDLVSEIVREVFEEQVASRNELLERIIVFFQSLFSRLPKIAVKVGFCVLQN